MPITIYGTKDCDTMKKARTWHSHGVAYGFHDYKTEGSTYGSKATNGIPRALLHGWLVRPATEPIGRWWKPWAIARKPDDYFDRIIFDARCWRVELRLVPAERVEPPKLRGE